MCFIRQALQQSVSRRAFIRGAGSLAAAPLLTSFGGNSRAASSTSQMLVADASRYHTRLVLLGTTGGPSWWAGSDRAGASSALVVRDTVTQTDCIYLIDMGCGSTTRLAQAFNAGAFVNTGGSDARGGKGQVFYSSFLRNVKGLFFTHLHQDHTTDYPALLLYGQGAGLVAHSPEDEDKRLQVFGPGTRGKLEDVFPLTRTPPTPVVTREGHATPGLTEMTQYLWCAYAQTINDFTYDNNWADFTWLVKLNDIELPPLPRADYPIDPDTGRSRNTAPWPDMDPIFVCQDSLVTVTATLVNHGPVYPSYAFRFDTPDGSVVFSGDTGYPCPNLVQLARGADVLVHEVIDQSFIDNLFHIPPLDQELPLKHHMETAHTTPRNAGNHAAAAGVKTLALNHIVPGNAPIAHLLTARESFSGTLFVGEDLMQIGVGKPIGRR